MLSAQGAGALALFHSVIIVTALVSVFYLSWVFGWLSYWRLHWLNGTLLLHFKGKKKILFFAFYFYILEFVET